MALIQKKKFSTLDSTAGGLYELSDEDIARLHETLLSMYKDITAKLEPYGIRFIAAGGTALGAVRHKGFIPWDDDMDLFILRRDYEKLKGVFDITLGEDYILLAPGVGEGANCFLPRIMKKNTTHLNMIDETSPHPHGIYIDLNIIEYAPENPALFSVKGVIADALRFISYSVYWKRYPSESLRKYMLGSSAKNYYRLRMALGTVFGFLSPERWFEIFDRFVIGKESDLYTVPSGTKHYRGEAIPVEKAVKFRRIPFEDTKIYVMRDVDWYLTNLYGDYHTIPEQADRERHLCVELSFSTKED